MSYWKTEVAEKLHRIGVEIEAMPGDFNTPGIPDPYDQNCPAITELMLDIIAACDAIKADISKPLSYRALGRLLSFIASSID